MDSRVRVYVWCVITWRLLPSRMRCVWWSPTFRGRSGSSWRGLRSQRNRHHCLPNVKAEISISETFLFSAVLIFGPSAGVYGAPGRRHHQPKDGQPQGPRLTAHFSTLRRQAWRSGWVGTDSLRGASRRVYWTGSRLASRV